MSTKEIELEIKRKEVELRILRKKLSVLASNNNSNVDKEESFLEMAKKYQSEFSKISDQDIDEIINGLNSPMDKWDQ